MTIEKFLEEVTNHNWIISGSFIRSEEELYTKGEFLPYHACPLCYVVYKLTGKKFRNHKFDDAAKELGLNHIQALDIASAADGKTTSDYQISLRERLILATSLQDQELKND